MKKERREQYGRPHQGDVVGPSSVGVRIHEASYERPNCRANKGRCRKEYIMGVGGCSRPKRISENSSARDSKKKALPDSPVEEMTDDHHHGPDILSHSQRVNPYDSESVRRNVD